MEFSRLAVIGIGSVRCGHPIVSSLASYFGERPLEITLYDADAERLDLFVRLAHMMFDFNQCSHTILATMDPNEALDGAERTIISMSDHCARKILKRPSLVGNEKKELLESILHPATAKTPVLNLLSNTLELDGNNVWNLSWPPIISDAERASIPHHILRVISGGDYPYDWLREYEKSPLKLWLENPASLSMN